MAGREGGEGEGEETEKERESRKTKSTDKTKLSITTEVKKLWPFKVIRGQQASSRKPRNDGEQLTPKN